MKIYAKMAAAAAIGLSMAACSFSGSSDANVEYLPFQESSKSEWGLIKPDGTVLYADEFKNVPTSVIDGVFFVEEGEGISLYKATPKKPTIVGDLEGLSCAGGFNEGLAPIVRKGERIEVINTSGKTQFTLMPVKDKEITSCSPTVSDGMLIVTTEEGKMGAYNTSGKLAIAPKFDRLTEFNEGYALAAKESDGETTYMVVNKKGETVFKIKENWDVNTYGTPFHEGWMPVEIDDRYALVNTKGEATKLPAKVEDIEGYNKTYVIFENDGKSGLMRIKDGEVLIRAKYDHMYFLPWDSKHVLVRDDDEYCVLDLKGEKTIDFKDDHDFVVAWQGKGFDGFIGGEDHDYAFFNKKGEEIKSKSKTDLYNISDPRVQTYYITSDYFDTAGFCKKLLKMIDTDGIDGINIHSYANAYYPSSITSSPSSYTYKYTFEPDGHTAEGYRYSISTKIVTDRTIASSQYVYDYYYYYGNWEYSINANNPIEKISLDVSGPSDLWSLVKEEVKAGMKEKGFKLSETSGDTTTFTCADSKVVFSAGGYGITVSMYPASSAAEEAVAEAAPEVVEEVDW